MFLIEVLVCLCFLHSKVVSIKLKDNTDVDICIWIKQIFWGFGSYAAV
jgi:hypothetical protein